ncbi:MAG: peroxiredoxin [Deltaproteobacteria bacterium]|nr:peroxiredoxin [Deltaproteobacteria bacterium]
MRDDFYSLPDNLPVPKDDGLCVHLEGLFLPNIELRATSNRIVNLVQITQKQTVLFFYPRTGRPDEPSPVGWNEIPGARGCTSQSCAYRDNYNSFQMLGIQVFGISVQPTEFQQELVQRIHLPFELLSDVDFKLTEALQLPTFEFCGMRLLKRMAWFCNKGKIEKVFYPIFPPDKNAFTVLEWIKSVQKSA